MPILHKDLKEFLRLLTAHKVRYLVVGGYAVGVHGYPRYTGDLDVFVESTTENAERIAAAFREFGFDLPQLSAESFTLPERIVEIGREPVKIQVMTTISGVSFDECHAKRVMVPVDDLQVAFIGYEQLIKNKSATGRDKDRVDVKALERQPRKP